MVGANSNWLKACAAVDQCDDLPACTCGACTSSCSSDADCEGLFDARCAPAADPATASQCASEQLASGQGICLPRCEPGSCDPGQACVERGCVLAELPASAFCADVREPGVQSRAGAEEVLELLQTSRTNGGADCGGTSAAPPVAGLRLDPRLLCAARVLAADLDATGMRSLTDSQGRTSEDRLAAVGYVQQLWAESFAVLTPSAQQALETMLSDAGVCTRLTDPRMLDVGVARVGSTWVVTVGRE